MIIATRIVRKPAFRVVGMKVRYQPNWEVPPSQNELSKLWQRFNPRSHEIPHADGGCYGLCLFDFGMKPGDAFDYVAALGVSDVGDVPEGMVAEEFGEYEYAVVERRGVLDELGKAFDYFHAEWLPKSGYEYAGGPEFEYYDERFKGNDDPESVMELWFPVRKKE